MADVVCLGYTDPIHRRLVNCSLNPKPRIYLHLWGGVVVLLLLLISLAALRPWRGVQELPLGVGEAKEGEVAELREPAEGSSDRKFPARSGRPPMGDSTTRAPPPPICSSPPPCISNTARVRYRPTPQVQSRRGNQAQEHNPHPTPQIQIGPGFQIRTAIDAAVADGVNIP